MNLKYSGLLFVLSVLFEAINAGVPVSDNAKPAVLIVQPTTDKPDVKLESNKTEIPPAQNGSVPVVPSIPTVPAPPAPPVPPVTPPTTKAPPLTSSPAPSPSPAPAPAPTPAPAPEKGKWVVHNNATQTTCIIAQMMMQLNITYPSKTENQTYALIQVPSNATASGVCSNSTQTMEIRWGPGHILQINFMANDTVKRFYISELSLTVNATVLKDAKVLGDNEMWNFKNNTHEFTTPLDMSYRCSKAQNLNLENEDPKRKAVLSLSDTQFEAFMNKTKAEFGAAQDCETFDTPDVVPIAVGCALALLVLVILIAYLVGRKCSQNRGYLSM